METYDDQLSPEARQQKLEDLQAAARLQVQRLWLDWLKQDVDAREQSGIEEEWRLAKDLYAGRQPEEGTEDIQIKNGPKKPGQSQVVINITEPKTNIAASQIIRRVLPGDMKPWEVEPTPVPEFDQAIAGGSDQPIQLADGSQAKATDVAKAAKKMLADKAARMSDQIQDWLTDSGIYRGKTAYAELRKMIKDGARLGTGVIKGPFPTQVEERKWTMNDNVATITVTQKTAPRIRAIKAENCYPDKSCGDNIQNGSRFTERDYLAESQVREFANQPGYEPEALAAVLAEGPQPWSKWDDRYKDERAGQVRVWDRSNFETFYLYANISPKNLIGCGYNVPTLTMAPEGLSEADAADALREQLEQAMQLDSVPIIATMINGKVVKVILNPNEKGGFPYRFFRWAEMDDRPWGKGVPMQMAVPQLLLTSAVRAMSENAGQSAGAITVMADGVTTPVNQKYQLNRNSFFTFTPDAATGIDDARKAFQLFTVPSVQKELAAIIQMAQEWADQLANIPLLMQGITGATPETLGGMEMLEANAASPLLDIAKEYDEVVGPLISDFYDWGMQDPNVDDGCKGDFKCVGIGATVLIHRDRRALALQQVAVPMAANPAFGLSPERVGEEVLKGVEIDPEKVKLTDEEKQAQQQQAGQQQDPRIVAAQLKAKTDSEIAQADIADKQQERAFKAQQAQLDRIFEKYTKELDFQIQALQFAGQKQISLEQLRGLMATKALELRNKRDLFVAERQFAETAGHGRGL